MIRARFLMALPLAIALAGATRPSDDAITVHQRFLYGICLGICYSTDLVVHSDGVVDLHLLGTPDRPGRHFRYRVGRTELLAFRATLRPVRPIGVSDTGHDCGDPQDPLTVKGVPAYDIVWQDDRGADRLLSCGEGGVPAAFRQAYAALRINPATGKRTG